MSSGLVSQVLNPAASATSVSTSGDGLAGDPVVLTAAVVAASGAPPAGPTGTVTFLVNGSQVGSPENLDGTGTATFDDSGADFATGGTQYTVTATYSGDADYSASSGTRPTPPTEPW